MPGCLHPSLVAAISRESLRQILRAARIKWQATKTWKASANPDFIAKMRRVLNLQPWPGYARRTATPTGSGTYSSPRGPMGG